MSWFKQIAQRLIWAHRALVADADNPEIRLDNGITLDLARNKVILDGDFSLEVTGNLKLAARGDLILQAGKGMGYETGIIDCGHNRMMFYGADDKQNIRIGQ